MKDCIIHPVKMSFCPGAIHRITFHFFADTHFFFRRNDQNLTGKSLIFQNLKSLPGHCSGYGFCCEIKNLFCQSFPHRTHSRKNRRHGFSHSRRRLNKQLHFAKNCSVYSGYHIPLSFPVRKRKF